MSHEMGPESDCGCAERMGRYNETYCDGRWEKCGYPPYNMEITTDDPEKIGQAFGNADFRIKSGEMGTYDREAISTSGTRIHPVRARHVKTLSSNITVQKNPGGTTP